jgi:peptidoglycan hydrolase-like protein with peptidoglycan-binding domain
VPVASGAWQFMGPNDLAPGPVTVTATLQGMPGVAPATLNLTVNPVLPVPADAGWALAALGALLAAVGLRRRPMA